VNGQPISYRDLVVWQKAMQLIDEIDEIVKVLRLLSALVARHTDAPRGPIYRVEHSRRTRCGLSASVFAASLGRKRFELGDWDTTSCSSAPRVRAERVYAVRTEAERGDWPNASQAQRASSRRPL